ncbi:MAG: Tyrosine recombinase XerD [Syntrophorhabdus sp. PtaU1.Bin002]|nr:MAG: Tyrosine recombinase XerD [Syntrophorhabdus sp. PtaU1.Bin002]
MRDNQNVVECSTFFDTSGAVNDTRMSALIDGFLEYAQYELNLSPKTVVKYRECLSWFIRDIGDKEIAELTIQDFVRLKRLTIERGVSQSRIASVVFATKSFLTYCRIFLKLATLDPKQIRPPRIARREVIFLHKEEIEAFTDTIGNRRLNDIRFRAVVETILGTGMRISEVLSLNRKDIQWDKREAKIVGKGNKERTVFFTARSLEWIRRYLECRRDSYEAVFVTSGNPRRLTPGDMWRFFRRHRVKAGITKKLTPHILRHTVATNLVFNGCPIVHVKEILGHERLDTTCKYYLGVDKALAKKAHKEYMNFAD